MFQIEDPSTWGNTVPMRTVSRLLCLLLAIVTGTGCASHSRDKRPHLYRGGQYYEDALHSADVKNR